MKKRSRIDWFNFSRGTDDILRREVIPEIAYGMAVLEDSCRKLWWGTRWIFVENAIDLDVKCVMRSAGGETFVSSCAFDYTAIEILHDMFLSAQVASIYEAVAEKCGITEDNVSHMHIPTS